jgi:acetyl esterase/lipase
MKHPIKTLTLALLMLAGASNIQAQWQKPINIDLWAQGLPNTNGIESQGYNDAERNYKPSITVYLPKAGAAPTRAVVICPGGGYYLLAMDHEGHQWAPFFNARGIAAIVLKYRMPHGNDAVPQSDAYEAIRTVKAHAKEWNINPDDIGIMGFSAGGHLASTVATHAPADISLKFQILMYPVITMDAAITHQGSREGLIGKSPTADKVRLYSNELQVNARTPRAFIALSDDDTTVPPLNAVHYYESLKKLNIPATMMIYPSGGHGWGINASFLYHAQMLTELDSWLKTF